MVLGWSWDRDVSCLPHLCIRLWYLSMVLLCINIYVFLSLSRNTYVMGCIGSCSWLKDHLGWDLLPGVAEDHMFWEVSAHCGKEEHAHEIRGKEGWTGQRRRSETGQEQVLEEGWGQNVQDPGDHNQIGNLSYSLLLARRYSDLKAQSQARLALSLRACLLMNGVQVSMGWDLKHHTQLLKGSTLAAFKRAWKS